MYKYCPFAEMRAKMATFPDPKLSSSRLLENELEFRFKLWRFYNMGRNDNYYYYLCMLLIYFPHCPRLFSSPQRTDQFWGPPTLQSSGYLGLFLREQRRRGVKLSTHLLVPRSRMVELHLQFLIYLHGIVLNKLRTSLYLLFLLNYLLGRNTHIFSNSRAL
jgi:hypothetical protein